MQSQIKLLTINKLQNDIRVPIYDTNIYHINNIYYRVHFFDIFILVIKINIKWNRWVQRNLH